MVGVEPHEDTSLTQWIGAGERPDAVSETKVLAELESRLFGRAIEPIRLDRYVLIERIGKGAFGSVYRAFDPELDRQVAIKLLDRRLPSLDAGETGEALLLEGQALARFTHPNVVAIYDVGTFDLTEGTTAGAVAAHASGVGGRGVYIVMELVDGQTLAQWLSAEEEREWHEVLDLFLQAGRGLAAAHGAGTVHRDFKPANVLVGQDGRVRVLDFGLAALANVELDEQGAQPRILAGTPTYMAPEQMEGRVPDAGADQYAFAFTLYEALFGPVPFRRAGLDEMAEAKRNLAFPEPGAGNKVPGWIRPVLLRALSPAREDRYASMQVLLDALAPPKRRPWGLWAGFTAMAVGLVGLAFWQAGAVDRTCRERAQDHLEGVWDPSVESRIAEAFRNSDSPHGDSAWTVLEPVLRQYVDGWRGRYEAVCAESIGGSVSPEASARELQCLERNIRRAGGLTGVFAQADAWVVARAVESALELPAAELCRRPTDRLGLTPETTVDPAGALEVQADVVRIEQLGRAGQYMEAEALSKRTVTRAEATGDPIALSDALVAQGRAQRGAGNLNDAEGSLWRALEAAERTRLGDNAVDAMAELLRCLSDQGRYEEAEGLLSVALARLEAGTVGAAVAIRLRYQAGVLRMDQNRPEEAVAFLEDGVATASEIYGDDHPRTANVLNALGNALKDAGRPDDALPRLERAREIWRDRLGDHHPSVALSVNNIGNVFFTRGQNEKALEYYEDARERYIAAFPVNHPQTATPFANLAATYMRLGRPWDAIESLNRAIEIDQANVGRGARQARYYYRMRGFARRALGWYAQAYEDFARTRELLIETDGPRTAGVATMIDAMGEALDGLKRHEEALALHEQAREIRRSLFEPGSQMLVTSMMTSSDSLSGLGRHEEALALRREALAARTQRYDADSVTVAWANVAVAESLLALGRHGEAAEVLERSVPTLRRELGDEDLDLLPVFVTQGRMFEARGRSDAARDAAKRALGVLSTIQDAHPDLRRDADALAKRLGL